MKKSGLSVLILAIVASIAGFSVVACKEDSGTKPAANAASGGAAEPEKKPLKPVDPATAGTIMGAVSFTGTAPAPTMIKAAGDAACTKLHPDEFSANDVAIKEGKVENTFVWIKSGLDGYSFPPNTEPVQVDQRGCMYNPRLIGVRVEQPIEFINSDATLHNIASKPEEQRGWNFVTPQGQQGRRTFSKQEVPIRIGCDVHPWMRAYIGVVDHPLFAITTADGVFKLSGVPPGDYTVGFWHERLGSGEVKVTLAANETKAADFTLPGPQAK